MAIHSTQDSQAQDVNTYLPYLSRDEVYNKEKPFGADFPIDHFQNSKIANHIFEKVPVVIKDARQKKSFDLNTNGFCFLEEKTSLTAEQAANTTTAAVASYLQEIERILYKNFPEYSRIEIMDFQVNNQCFGK